MNPIKNFLIICVLSILTHGISAETVTCQYSERNITVHLTHLNKYACGLSLGNSERFVSLTEIDGDHQTGKYNEDDQYLYISSRSKMETFLSIFCDTFPNLEAIKIENVEIGSIDVDSLQNCLNLKLFHLNNNKIREFPEHLLSENSELVELVISSNLLQTLSRDAFDMQRNLKKLVLKKNKINFLPPKVFVALRNLEVLDLENNQIRNLYPVWFRELISLLVLNLNSNGITELPRGVFTSLSKLEELLMASNSLRRINSNSFGNRTKLRLMQMNNNQIDAIDPKLIQDSQLRTIAMANNVCFQGTLQQKNEFINQLKDCFRNFDRDYKSCFPPRTTPSTPTTTTTTTTRRPIKTATLTQEIHHNLA